MAVPSPQKSLKEEGPEKANQPNDTESAQKDVAACKEMSEEVEICLHEIGVHLGFRRFHILLLAASLVIGTVPSAILGTTPYVLKEVMQEYHVDEATVAFLSSGTTFGSAVAAAVLGVLGDRMGRRTVLVACLVIACLGSAAHLLLPTSWSFGTLVAARVFLGIPYGGIYAVLIPYLLEFFADDWRGAAACVLNLSWPVGSIYSIQVVAASHGNWRLALAAPFPLCVIALVALMGLPESPRWLFTAHREKEGQSIIDGVFESPALCASAQTRTAPRVSHIERTTGEEEGVWSSLAKLCSPQLRCTTVIACTLHFLANVGSTAPWIFGPEIIEGATGEEAADLWIFSASEGVSALGTLLSLVLIDRVGRKPLFVTSALLAAACFLALLGHPSVELASGVWLVMSFAQGVMWSVFTTYIGEAFPTVLRATGTAFAAVFGRTSAFVGPIIFGALFETSLALALLGAVAGFVGVAVAAALIPKETAGAAMQDA